MLGVEALYKSTTFTFTIVVVVVIMIKIDVWTGVSHPGGVTDKAMVHAMPGQSLAWVQVQIMGPVGR